MPTRSHCFRSQQNRIRPRMRSWRQLLAAAVLAAPIWAGAAAARDGALSENLVEPASDPWPAPIGHRQPHLGDLPADVRQDEGEITRSERDLDKLIDNICRGC